MSIVYLFAVDHSDRASRTVKEAKSASHASKNHNNVKKIKERHLSLRFSSTRCSKKVRNVLHCTACCLGTEFLLSSFGKHRMLERKDHTCMSIVIRFAAYHFDQATRTMNAAKLHQVPAKNSTVLNQITEIHLSLRLNFMRCSKKVRNVFR